MKTNVGLCGISDINKECFAVVVPTPCNHSLLAVKINAF